MTTENEEKRKMSRREFIKSSSIAGTGLALGGFGVLAPRRASRPSGSLKLRTLGRTELQVTELGFGGLHIRRAETLHIAIEKGVNIVHISPYYRFGRNIEIFGEVMKTKRDRVFLALKEVPESSKVQEALEKLYTDYADILVTPLHSVEAISNPELPGAYQKLKDEGKIRFSGFSCHSNMVDVITKAIELGFFDVMLIRYNLDNREELDPILAEARATQNMGCMAMKVVKRLTLGRKDEIPEALRETITNQNLDTMLIGMSNSHELNINIDALTMHYSPTSWTDLRMPM